MNDIMGNELHIGDTVVTSAYGAQISRYTVIGFTPQKVRLSRVTDFSLLKYPSEVALVVIPEGMN